MGADGLRIERRDGMLVLTLDRPPSNALGPGERARMIDALPTEVSDVRAVVLAGAGVNFSSAVALDADPSVPGLEVLTAAVAACPVPVVAAVQGLAMGPGAELALAATARVGTKDTRIAFPEIVLGLCPNGGTTSRLPRLIGAETALRLLLTGRAVAAEEALGLGLLDAIADTALMDAALALAEQLSAGKTLLRKPVDPVAWQAAVASARRAQAVPDGAAGRIVDCVEAALLLPPKMAQDYEAVTRDDLEATPDAAALRSAAKADRRAATLPPAVARAMGLPVDRVLLSGAAEGLEDVARAALSRGLPVLWPDAPAGMSERLGPMGGLVQTDHDPAIWASSPLQVHSRSPTATVLKRMPQNGAVLILNGAEGEMGLAVSPSGKASELAVLAEEDPSAIATAITGLRRIGLPPVLVGQSPVLGARVVAAGGMALQRMLGLGAKRESILEVVGGFPVALPDEDNPEGSIHPTPEEIRNRWLAAMANEALRLLDQGIARRPSDVDHLLVSGYAFPRRLGGPMHQAERRGLMLLRRDLRSWAGDHPIWSPAPLLDRLIQDGLQLSALDG